MPEPLAILLILGAFFLGRWLERSEAERRHREDRAAAIADAKAEK